MLRSTHFAFRSMWYAVHVTWVHAMWIRDLWYMLRDMWVTSCVLRLTCFMSTCYVDRLVRVTYYAVRDTWLSLHYFPPLVSFEGLFACRKWFCFLELKIKNRWGFGFRYGNFSGKGKKGQYLNGCYFCGIYIIRCREHIYKYQNGVCLVGLSAICPSARQRRD